MTLFTQFLEKIFQMIRSVTIRLLRISYFQWYYTQCYEVKRR